MSPCPITVPEQRPEPVWERSLETIETAIGCATVVVEGSDRREDHPALTLRCRWADLNGVLYTWEATFDCVDGHYRAGRRWLERERGGGLLGKPPAEGASRRFHTAVDEMGPQVDDWAATHPEEILARRVYSLHAGAHYLSREIARDAAALTEKIDRLETIEREIASLEGTVPIRPGARQRLSPLAASA